MQPIRIVVTAVFCAFALGACNKAPTPPPDAPTVSPPAVEPTVPPAPPATSSTGTDTSATAGDSRATNPMGTLSKGEESKSMPMAGQAGSESSPSVEQGSKK